jgi:hypothetical protein
MAFGKYPLGYGTPLFRITKDMMLKRRAKQAQLKKGFKNPKFLAKAKLKDYDTVL